MEASWERLRGVLEASWMYLGGVLGASWGVLWASWERHAVSWGDLERLGGVLGRPSEQKYEKQKILKTIGFAVILGSLATQKTFAKQSTRRGCVLESPFNASGAPRSGRDEPARTERREKFRKPFRKACGAALEGGSETPPPPPTSAGAPGGVGEVFHLPSR